MVKLRLRPNDEGKNGLGMWVRYNKSRYELDFAPPGAMGSHVWALVINDQHGGDGHLLIYADRGMNQMLGEAKFVRQLSVKEARS